MSNSTMKFRRITVPLWRLVDTTVEDVAEDGIESLPLTQYASWPNEDLIAVSDLDQPIISILDGYHRAAGLLVWARNQGIDPTNVDIPVLEILNPILIKALCDLHPGTSAWVVLTSEYDRTHLKDLDAIKTIFDDKYAETTITYRGVVVGEASWEYQEQNDEWRYSGTSRDC